MSKSRSGAYMIELLIHGVLIGAMLSVLLGYVYGDGLMPLAVGLGVSIASSYLFAFIRSITKKFSMFFLAHLAFAALVVFIVPIVVAKVITAVALVVHIVVSVMQLKKSFQEGRNVHFGMAAIFLIGSYCASERSLQLLGYACFVLTAVFMALYFIREGFDNTQKFIEHNDNGKNAPLKDIKLRSYTLVCSFGAIVALFMIAVRYMGGQYLIDQLSKAFLTVASAMVKWILYHLRGSYAKAEPAIQEDFFGYLKENFKAREFPPAVVIIEKIIRYFFIAAIIIGAIALVVWLLFRLYSVFGGQRDNLRQKDKTEYIRKTSVDKATKVSRKVEKRHHVNKARRYYKKYIADHMSKDKALGDSKTPLEISQYLGLDHKDTDAQIRRIYEKARYSSQECTKEELRLLKEYIKGKK